MAYKRTENPPWSWSSSRKETFNECKRKYYYNYYLAHNGWEDGAPEESRLAYRLKNMTGIHMILGNAVHEAAEYALKSIAGSEPAPARDILLDMVKRKLNQAWKQSKTPQLFLRQPKQHFMLYEFYYGYGIPQSVIEKVKTKMENSVSNILNSETLREVLADNCRIRFAEQMDTFELFGTSIYAVPDLVFERPGGDWVVVDWKTGKEHDSHPSQINIYGMYLKHKLAIGHDNITGRVEYLVTGKNREVLINEETLNQSCSQIKNSIIEMKEFLLDPDENIPLDKESYPLTKHTRFCKWCNFYQLCKEELDISNYEKDFYS
jgi:CRISPR/Cas system-associated exonuclease Cas4 (RecB family)